MPSAAAVLTGGLDPLLVHCASEWVLRSVAIATDTNDALSFEWTTELKDPTLSFVGHEASSLLIVQLWVPQGLHRCDEGSNFAADGDLSACPAVLLRRLCVSECSDFSVLLWCLSLLRE